jgi:predicted lipoprotein with Yx(FWY)xxD motif
MSMTIRAAAATLLALALIAGCGQGSAAAPVPLPSVGEAAAPSEASLSWPGPVELALARTTLGQTLTSDGRTIYRFEADSADPPRSICENDCLAVWPPLLTDGSPIALEGSIDRSLIGTLQRADGTTQVTLAGWPLYWFVDDKAPGDVTGEGVGGNWSAVGNDGKPLVRK